MENTNTIKTFKTHEPSGFQKLMQVYWLIPKRSRLDTLTFDGQIISIKTQFGNEITAPVSELHVRFFKDKYDRWQIVIKHANSKLTIMEIPYTMTDEEWDEVLDILKLAPGAKESTWSKGLSFLQNILDFFK